MRRPEDLDASFGGIPLTSLRGLAPEYFEQHDPQPEYYIEDEGSLLPTGTLEHGAAILAYSSGESITDSAIQHPKLQEFIKIGEEELPVDKFRFDLVDSVENNLFTIVAAETGAGKSTRITHFLLAANRWDTIYLTQPRREAARNVFRRTKYELGEDKEHLISYQTAEKLEGPKDAKIKIVTDGLQLMHMLNNKGIGGNDVIILDELHEWNNNLEVMFALIKRTPKENPNVHFVFMSATMEVQNLADNLAEISGERPPVFEIPGRMHEIEFREEPDSTVSIEAVEAAVKITESGETDLNGILVFDPGKREIADTIDEIRRRLPPEIERVATILPLHAKLSSNAREAALAHYPGVKIVVSTDVAQTSLTIPDIKYIIDSGLQRRIELDHEGVQGLVLHPVSKADLLQRGGRAGRVGPGIHILTRQDETMPFIPFADREEYPVPEILRTDIVRNTLRFAAVGLDISELDLYHPVDPSFITRSQETLRTLGALDENNLITRLGERMNEFPVDVLSGRMMAEVGRYSERTRAYLSVIVAAKEAGGLQYFDYKSQKRWQELVTTDSSDLLAQLEIFIAIQEMNKTDMTRYDIDVQNVERTREIYEKVARKAGVKAELYTLLPPPNSQEIENLKNCIYAGSITSIYRHEGGGTYVHVGGPESSHEPREISNRSVVRGRPSAIVGRAYRVHFMRNGDGEPVVRHIVESATTTTLSEMAKFAPNLTQWKPDGFAMREGKFVQLRRQFLDDIDLHLIEEDPAELSPQLQEALIAHVLENPGNQQMKLREIKVELERLALIAKDPVKQLTQDDLLRMLKEASADTVDPSKVDDNLRLIMYRDDITIDFYETKERRERIARDAPRSYESNGVTLPLIYQHRKPVVGRYTRASIERLTDELHLADGRPIMFLYDDRPISLLELQEKLGVGSFAQQR